MTGWHGRSQRTPVGATRERQLSVWTRRLALLVTALGLVLMHHVVGAHQHRRADATIAAAPAHADHRPLSVAFVAPAEGDGHGMAPTASAGAAPWAAAAAGDSENSSGPVAVLHEHPGGESHDHAGTLLHLCLAALLSAGVLLLVLLVASARWRDERSPHLVSVAVATAPRAPPTACRLAALQVLRL